VTKKTSSPKTSSSIPNISPARLAAFQILQRVEKEGAFATVLLATQAEALRPNDRALCHELVMGVLRRRLWLDRSLAHYAERDPERMDLAVRLALRLGLYQLRFLTRVPAAAAINEAVNLVRRARLRSAAPFVNAILRRATRELDFDPANQIFDPIERLAIETSHPPWLIERWAGIWGFAETAALAHANNEPAPLAFRIVQPALNQNLVFASLESTGAEVFPSATTPGAWRTNGAAAVLHELAGSGRIYFQDKASQLVAQIVDARAGDKVLDVCAAPGSKTTHLADLNRDEILVIAGDLYEHRLRTVLAAAATQRLTRICGVALDARARLPFGEAVFDRVLVDAPCTGTGTLRRNPEIRWRLKSADIGALAELQLQILLNAARSVKPGGRLIYSTCSLEPEENEEVITRFLEQTERFVPASLSVNPTLLSDSGAARIWPHRNDADGFFIAAFSRN